MKRIYLFLFEGFSDWEISYVTPELNKSEQFELIYCSKDGKSIRSMGGLQVQPDCVLADVKVAELDLLILPGGTAWEKGENREIDSLVKEAFEKGKAIAGICAATTYLGRLGLLDDVKHCSNDLNYLKAVAPEYCGEKYYQNEFAVSHRNMITANGIASIEFAREIFKLMKLYDEKELEQWFQLFKHGVWSE